MNFGDGGDGGDGGDDDDDDDDDEWKRQKMFFPIKQLIFWQNLFLNGN